MSLWKDNTPPKPVTPTPTEPRETARAEMPRTDAPAFAAAPLAGASALESDRGRKESLIAADITIEGKIEGSGSVRIAGRFKGDVNVQGDLLIEAGAKVTGAVRADKVVVAGELEGNIDSATRVELQQSGAITGDVNAGAFTVAAGARMRGQAVFGWDENKPGARPERSAKGGSAERAADA